LSFEIKLMNVLAVVDSLGVNLFVSEEHALPDGLIRLLKADVEELSVLDAPKAVLYLYLLAEFTLKERSLALESDTQMLLLDLNIELVCLSAFRNRNLDLNIEDSLRPVVLLC